MRPHICPLPIFFRCAGGGGEPDDGVDVAFDRRAQQRSSRVRSAFAKASADRGGRVPTFTAGVALAGRGSDEAEPRPWA